MKITKDTTSCMYCDPDKYGREPISYNHVYVDGRILFTLGMYIHLKDSLSELSSYILNTECEIVFDSRTPVNYCPICGRKLVKE